MIKESNDCYRVVQVENKVQRHDFIELPNRIFREDANWVPMLPSQGKEQLNEESNPIFHKGPYCLLLVYKNNIPISRMFLGIDEEVNRRGKRKWGYFTLFDTMNDQEGVDRLFEHALKWLQERDMTHIWGPLEPTGGEIDEKKGVLIEGFEHPHVFMMNYNQPYYSEVLEKAGFLKERDLCAYYIHGREATKNQWTKQIQWIEKKFGIRVDAVNPKKMKEELSDIVTILQECLTDIEDEKEADYWFDTLVPTVEELIEPAKQLLKLSDKNLMVIARAKGKPIGVALGMTDLNMAIKKMKGKEGPISVLKFVYYKNKINRYRFFTLFVVPKYRKFGATLAIFNQLNNYMSSKHGTDYEMDFSHIRMDNMPMRQAAEKARLKVYKKYRIYKKAIDWEVVKAGKKTGKKTGQSNKETLISLENVSKIYHSSEVKVEALKKINFKIYKGEFLVVLGASGSGKSTLLNLLGGMDRPTEGNIVVDDWSINEGTQKELTYYRREEVGFVLQFYNLIPDLTAVENVNMVAKRVKNGPTAESVLKEVGMADKLDCFPSQLSGGEQQRVSIARAIVKNPKLLLCDEPTGALDYETGKQVLSILMEVARKHNGTVVIVTHNNAIAKAADRVIRMRSGEIIEEYMNTDKIPVERIEW